MVCLRRQLPPYILKKEKGSEKMCIGKAMIICKGSRYPKYLMDSNDHEPLVKKLHLKDDQPPELKKFIRVEMLPIGSLTSTNPDCWNFHIDENNRLPDWFENKKEDWECKCKALMVKIIILSWIKNGIVGSLVLLGTKIPVSASSTASAARLTYKTQR